MTTRKGRHHPGTAQSSRSSPSSQARRRPDLQVTAEKLNDDSTRRVEVAQRADHGRWPLHLVSAAARQLHRAPTTLRSRSSTGPGSRRSSSREVPVTKGAPSSGSNVALGTITLGASELRMPPTLRRGTPISPRGARVGFYQTLPDDSAPRTSSTSNPIDPLSGSSRRRNAARAHTDRCVRHLRHIVHTRCRRLRRKAPPSIRSPRSRRSTGTVPSRTRCSAPPATATDVASLYRSGCADPINGRIRHDRRASERRHAREVRARVHCSSLITARWSPPFRWMMRSPAPPPRRP